MDLDVKIPFNWLGFCLFYLWHTHNSPYFSIHGLCTYVTANDRFVCLGGLVQLEATDIANVFLVVELRVKLRISKIPT